MEKINRVREGMLTDKKDAIIPLLGKNEIKANINIPPISCHEKSKKIIRSNSGRISFFCMILIIMNLLIFK